MTYMGPASCFGNKMARCCPAHSTERAAVLVFDQRGFQKKFFSFLRSIASTSMEGFRLSKHRDNPAAHSGVGDECM